jgi:hypothetical protein
MGGAQSGSGGAGEWHSERGGDGPLPTAQSAVASQAQPIPGQINMRLVLEDAFCLKKTFCPKRACGGLGRIFGVARRAADIGVAANPACRVKAPSKRRSSFPTIHLD